MAAKKWQEKTQVKVEETKQEETQVTAVVIPTMDDVRVAVTNKYRIYLTRIDGGLVSTLIYLANELCEIL